MGWRGVLWLVREGVCGRCSKRCFGACSAGVRFSSCSTPVVCDCGGSILALAQGKEGKGTKGRRHVHLLFHGVGHASVAGTSVALVVAFRGNPPFFSLPLCCHRLPPPRWSRRARGLWLRVRRFVSRGRNNSAKLTRLGLVWCIAPATGVLIFRLHI